MSNFGSSEIDEQFIFEATQKISDIFVGKSYGQALMILSIELGRLYGESCQNEAVAKEAFLMEGVPRTLRNIETYFSTQEEDDGPLGVPEGGT